MKHRISVGLPSRPVLPLSGFVAAPCLEVLFRFVRQNEVFHSFILRATLSRPADCSSSPEEGRKVISGSRSCKPDRPPSRIATVPLSIYVLRLHSLRELCLAYVIGDMRRSAE